ncbi:uncharacterized protein HaLaN_07351 [Haematococcus lacustris]|uniref:Uncharacterized protein n=1 Tax=Haematococcus lacustris TaxID=44745 RepID=A0A699YRC2_HAELA|nr:uncharacterized protein HaLaN_07351 [Haematococcus lacustris]
MASSSIGPENTRGVVLLIGAPGVGKTCLGIAMVAQQAEKGGSGGAPLFFSVGERIRADGLLAKHVAPDERAAVLVLEAVKDREGADDLQELLKQHSVPLLQVLYLPHDVASAVATWGIRVSQQRDAEHQVAERQAKWQRAAGGLLELYSSLGCLAELAGSSRLGATRQPVTSCRLVSCSRARSAVLAEAEAFTGLHPLPLPVPSRSVTCSADAHWLAYPGRYLAALKADGVRHLLITTATGQPFLLNRAGALYAYPMQTAPSQPAAAGQEGALIGKAVLEGEEQQAVSAGHIALEVQLQQLSLQGSGAAEVQRAPSRTCDVAALPPAALPPCGLPPCTVLDGELVLHGCGAQPLFLVFDALCVGGSQVWQLPLTARLQHLDSLGLTTASEAVTGQAAASVFTPALQVPLAAILPGATAAVPPSGFVKQQQGPPRGQDTVLVLRKPCFPVSPSGLLQLEAEAKRCAFPADGVVFSPCAMSSVLGQAELLIKWQPPGSVGVDMLGSHAHSLPQPSFKVDGSLVIAFLWQGQVHACTRRRMTSEQAVWAQGKGWVVTLGSSGQRAKLVNDSFKRAHYEAQLLHPLSVWDRVRQGASRDQLLLPWLPSHLRCEAEAVLAALNCRFQETFAKAWPKGPLAGRLVPGPEPACTVLQTPQFFELVLAALDGFSALRVKAAG